jgi:signal peptidase I
MRILVTKKQTSNKGRAVNRLKRWIGSELGQFAVLVILLLAGRSSLADHYFVPSGSMEYTLMPGDRVIVVKTAYGIRFPFTKVDLFNVSKPQVGEVAVFDSPENGTLLIKRIVAVGGDHVELVDGHLWVNREPLATTAQPTSENYDGRIGLLNLEHGGGPDIRGMLLPDGTVLVLGDHRGNSRDGRFFGLIAERELYGRAVAVYYSRREGFRWNRL